MRQCKYALHVASMYNLPNTLFLFSVASNPVHWGTESNNDLAMNSLIELYDYDARQHTQILRCFMENHPSLYADLLSRASLKKVELCQRIVSLWWTRHTREGFGSHIILQMFVQCLSRSYPIVLSSHANILQGKGSPFCA